MKLKISLARHNCRSAVAFVENNEMDVQLSDCAKPKTACLHAAKMLRDAAARFELLAQEPDPYHCETHDRINRAEVPNNQDVTKDAEGQSRLTDVLYVVKLENGVWLSVGRGDPPRTLVIERAKKFKTIDAAATAIIRARKQRNFKYAEIETYNI